MTDESMDKFSQAAAYLPPALRTALMRAPGEVRLNAQEIHIRCGCPVTVCCRNMLYYLTENGLSESCDSAGLVCATERDVHETLAAMCSYSVYTHQQEINLGFISLRGGHRAGVCGRAVIPAQGTPTVSDISSINLRIARELPGCAETLLKRTYGRLEQGLLLAGAPESGKTTLLRDIARSLSFDGRRVAVVDERGEIGAACRGERGHSLGPNCDLLSGYPKGMGVMHALRGLAPEFIVCDEPGGEEDCIALEQGMHAGAAFIATVHAGSRADLLRRETAGRLLRTGAFATVALLKSRYAPGEIQEIFRAEDLLDTERGHDFIDVGRDGDRVHSFRASRPAG